MGVELQKRQEDIEVVQREGMLHNEFYIRENGRAIGSVTYVYKEDELFIEEIHILKNKRRLGFGSQLLESVEEFSRENGLKAISGKFIAPPNEEEMVKKYLEKNGFEILEDGTVNKKLH